MQMDYSPQLFLGENVSFGKILDYCLPDDSTGGEDSIVVGVVS